MKFLAWQQIYRSPDNDGGNGTGGTSAGDGKNTNAGGEAGNSGENAGTNGGNGTQNTDSNGNQKQNGDGNQNTGTQTDDKKFSQADLDRVVSERLQREKDKQERDAKEKQGEFEKLYGEIKPKFETTVQENETLKLRLQALETAGHKQIDSLIKDWPKEVKDLDPGNKDLESRQLWVERVKPLADKLVNGGRAPNLETGDKGKGNNKAGSSAQDFMKRRYGDVSPKA